MTEIAEDDRDDLSFGTPEMWATYLPGPDTVPAYLSSRFAAQYRALIEVMLEAQDKSLTGLSFEEVADGVRDYLCERLPDDVADVLLSEDRFHLDARLERLVQWGALSRWQDPARTGEDFLRRRDRYQLTPQAARLHAFWTEELHADEAAAADITLAPRAIHTRISDFVAAIQGLRYQDAASEFLSIIQLHKGMATAARTWQRGLAHALSGGPDTEKQDLLWRTLSSYVEMWGEQVDIHSPAIAHLMADAMPLLTESVWRACCRMAQEKADDEQIAIQADRWQRTWAALISWFGTDGQARRLRRRLRDLVSPWARNMHILLDTSGTVTRRAELLVLAQAIEHAPDDTEAWQMWDTATGLFAARHLLLPTDAADDHHTRWEDAPPAPVTARFREKGVRAAVGRRPSVPDYSAGRAAARRARAATAAARTEAEAALRNRSGTELGNWEALDENEFDLLLEFLGVARGPKGDVRTGVTSDGRWQVRFQPVTVGETTIEVLSPRGRLATRNWRFEMERLG